MKERFGGMREVWGRRVEVSEDVLEKRSQSML